MSQFYAGAGKRRDRSSYRRPPLSALAREEAAARWSVGQGETDLARDVFARVIVCASRGLEWKPEGVSANVTAWNERGPRGRCEAASPELEEGERWREGPLTRYRVLGLAVG